MSARSCFVFYLGFPKETPELKFRLRFWVFFFFNNSILAYRVVCCSHQLDRLGHVSRTYQIAALGYVSRTNQCVVFVLWFEWCSNFKQLTRGFVKRSHHLEWQKWWLFCILTCILPHLMRNAILLDGFQSQEIIREI